MNSPIHIQLAKWTVPTIAVVVAFFWYKRRRIDRSELQWNDSGGTVTSNVETAILNDTKEIDTSPCRSGKDINQESLIDCHTRQEEPTRVPRKVSESMDIPLKNSTSQTNFCSNNQSAYAELCNTDVEFGSNPSASYFEMIATSASFKSSKNVDNVTRICENVTSEEQILPCETEPSGQHCITDECNHKEDGQQFEGHITQNQGQELDERDSANHSPVSVLDGSVTDEARSEGSNTDSGKGEYWSNQVAEDKRVRGDIIYQDLLEKRSLIPLFDCVDYWQFSQCSNSQFRPVMLNYLSLPFQAIFFENIPNILNGGSINGGKKDNVAPSTYNFAIPQHLVGRLIGRHGSFLHSIRTKANVGIYVNDHPCDGDHKICSIRGSVEGIKVALKMIRQKFPEKRFPQVTLAEISTIPEVNEVPAYNVLVQRPLSLVDGVNNDINISHIVKPNWLFVQLPTHPSFLLLQNLELHMTNWYNEDMLPIPDVLNKGDYVAVYWSDKWVRGYIERPDPSGERSVVRLLDYGGYWQFSNSQCRPLICNYLSLPFQAIEVFLANIQPKNGKWSTEAYNVVQSCSSKGVAQAQIEGRIQTNIYANIYFIIQNYGLISLTEELIINGHAEQVAWEQMKPETLESICTEL